MASLVAPEPSQLSDLRQKAVELSRQSREFPAPLPIIIPVASSEIDPEAEDTIGSQALSSLYNSDKYSDLTIKCQDRLWRAHKAVVCTQSKVLAACVDGPFRESATAEIDLSEDEPEIVEHMMSFLYKGFYDFTDPIPAIGYQPDIKTSTLQSQLSWTWRINRKPSHPSPSTTDLTPPYAIPKPSLITTSANITTQIADQTFGRVAPTPSRLITHASVYCLADQYDLPRLKNHALCKYAAIAPAAWTSPFFIPSLKLIYERTPARHPQIDDLRAIAAKVAAEHAQVLLGKIEFLEACTEIGELATDVLRMTLELRKMEVRVDWKPTVWCQSDQRHELVYIPSLTGFGMRSGTGGMGTSDSSLALQGFGSKNGGRYKCIPCGKYVE